MKQILIKIASLSLLFSVVSTYACSDCGCTPSPTEEAQPTEEAPSNVEAQPAPPATNVEAQPAPPASSAPELDEQEMP